MNHSLSSNENHSSISMEDDLIVEEFASVGDIFSQYTLLVELSSRLPVLTESQKESCTLVDKCQSQVWVRLELCDTDWAEDAAEAGEPRVHLIAESDTLIVRGVLYLLARLVDGRSAREVSQLEATFVMRTELRDAFTSERLNGFKEIVRTIRKQASLLEEERSHA